jgi:hypothetical protein
LDKGVIRKQLRARLIETAVKLSIKQEKQEKARESKRSKNSFYICCKINVNRRNSGEED